MTNCANCGHVLDLYIRTIQIMKPCMMPITIEQELEDKLTEVTGYAYLKFNPVYCPICGARMKVGDEK